MDVAAHYIDDVIVQFEKMKALGDKRSHRFPTMS